jgi:hypothetical protein
VLVSATVPNSLEVEMYRFNLSFSSTAEYVVGVLLVAAMIAAAIA